MKTTMFEYADGSGNTYIITNNTIEYIPVTKENSSTGNYSGGEPAKRKISESDFQKVLSYVNEICENKSIHIKDRMKGSGKITVISNEKDREAVIIYKGDEKEKLEELLMKLIK